jgi:translation initiation factor IF-3
LRTNEEIRTPKVRLIDEKGEQVGVVSTYEALRMAQDAELDLVEIVPTSTPPVCKIMNFGKYRYDQTKREKENKKTQHQIKVKEIKFKPNIDDNDLNTKMRQAKEFLQKGNKVKLTLAFRGREMMHPEVGKALIAKVCDDLAEFAVTEAPPSMMGRLLSTVLAPKAKKK